MSLKSRTWELRIKYPLQGLCSELFKVWERKKKTRTLCLGANVTSRTPRPTYFLFSDQYCKIIHKMYVHAVHEQFS